MKRGSREKETLPSPKRQHHSEISNGIHIPWDLTVDIVSRLPVKSLVRFQCVSKQWSSLITDTITTRSTEPGLLKVFPHWLLQPSLFSSSTYPQNTTQKTFISLSADKNTTYTLSCGLSCDFEYQYIRGLLCSLSSDFFSQLSLVLPKMEYEYDKGNNNDGCLWYDLVENQVFTLLGQNHRWRSLDIQGFGNHPPRSTNAGICINGMFYYVAHYPKSNELMRFDLKSERLDHIQMPTVLGTNELENLTLVNYQGKLGCIGHDTDRAEMWIVEEDQIEKQEWSKITLAIPSDLLESLLGDQHCIIAGVTPSGEIVMMQRTLDSAAQICCAFYYYPSRKETARLRFQRRDGSLYIL